MNTIQIKLNKYIDYKVPSFLKPLYSKYDSDWKFQCRIDIDGFEKGISLVSDNSLEDIVECMLNISLFQKLLKLIGYNYEVITMTKPFDLKYCYDGFKLEDVKLSEDVKIYNGHKKARFNVSMYSKPLKLTIDKEHVDDVKAVPYIIFDDMYTIEEIVVIISLLERIKKFTMFLNKKFGLELFDIITQDIRYEGVEMHIDEFIRKTMDVDVKDILLKRKGDG